VPLTCTMRLIFLFVVSSLLQRRATPNGSCRIA
jgi:hypothetical protein